jgi:hypothetical protein
MSTYKKTNKVVHCKKEKYDQYIGRPTKWGNPFSHLPNSAAHIRVKNREEAVEAYREWLLGTNYRGVLQEQRQWILDNLPILKGKTLGCFCAPKSCHGDVLRELLNSSTAETDEYKID